MKWPREFSSRGLLLFCTQVVLEEDREVMGDKKIWRSVLLFRDEWPLLSAGFLLLFLQVVCSQFIPQLTKAYSNAMYALYFLIEIK